MSRTYTNTYYYYITILLYYYIAHTKKCKHKSNILKFYGSEVKRWWMRFVRRTRPWNKWKTRCMESRHGASLRHGIQSNCCLDAPVSNSCPARVHLVSISCPSRVHLVSICPSRQIWMISNFDAFVCCNFSNSIFCVWSFMIWKVILGYILFRYSFFT